MTPLEIMKTRPFPKVELLKGKALEMRKKCLTEPVECDIIKEKLRKR